MYCATAEQYKQIEPSAYFKTMGTAKDVLYLATLLLGSVVRKRLLGAPALAVCRRRQNSYRPL